MYGRHRRETPPRFTVGTEVINGEHVAHLYHYGVRVLTHHAFTQAEAVEGARFRGSAAFRDTLTNPEEIMAARLGDSRGNIP